MFIFNLKDGAKKAVTFLTPCARAAAAADRQATAHGSVAHRSAARIVVGVKIADWVPGIVERPALAWVAA